MVYVPVASQSEDLQPTIPISSYADIRRFEPNLLRKRKPKRSVCVCMSCSLCDAERTDRERQDDQNGEDHYPDTPSH